MGRLLLGTSGWSYPEWIGVFYPNSTESKLKHYTQVFPTAEIDSTFYAFPQPGTVLGWNRFSPKEFIFCAKVPQTITHEKLAEIGPSLESELDRFAELMLPLNNSGKLGCLLLQMPPKYKYDLSHLESFLSILPHGFKYAIEFRHKSWLQDSTWPLLSKYNVAYTIVDEPLLPPEAHVTADFAYIRWHGHGQRPWYDYHYSEQELKSWVPKVKEVEPSVKTTYGYFNNHFHGYAVENALRILQMMGKLTPAQGAALNRAKTHLEGGKGPEGLGEWVKGGEDRPKIIDLLSSLMGESRLARALAIRDEEVTIKSSTNEKVVAKIRDYNLSMDFETRTITHDCGDWERSIETRQLCKHVGKVLLSLSEKIALGWVTQIHEDPEEWHFQKPIGKTVTT
ncbi:DUF72 domain-containing protein [Candidatus Bathyarchaeota archaeon]|nr:MAG: DUF72 domain-containing protein [Candidatus Bathyarchaeota archaeon]